MITAENAVENKCPYPDCGAGDENLIHHTADLCKDDNGVHYVSKSVDCEACGRNFIQEFKLVYDESLIDDDEEE